ncbi:MAG: DUF262 domain-containing protein [Chloroflexota bacterium]|nr:DUF262 domain-containing protein [Chloroflexota bacterium]
MGQIEESFPTIENLATRFHEGKLAMPEIQRDQVWTPRQVQELIDSLYRGYPVGTMLFWNTDDTVATREHSIDASQTSVFILDGQQRLTALSGLRFENAPDIRFNVESDDFAVATKSTKDDPLWVSVSEILESGVISTAKKHGFLKRDDDEVVLERLERVQKIKDVKVTVHTVRDFDYEEVAEIFIRANTTGRPLGSADIAIARIALGVPGLVSDDLSEFRETLDSVGWDIPMPLIMRCIAAIATGRSELKGIDSLSSGKITEAWNLAKPAIETFLNCLENDLGIESWSWISSSNALVVPVSYLAGQESGSFDKSGLLRWFLLSLVWQRYSAGVEGRLNQDLQALDEPDPFKPLEKRLRQVAGGRLDLKGSDLEKTGRGRFLLMAYLACRGRKATDWFSETTLSSTNLGSQNRLEEHHIFPRDLVKDDHESEQVDELANIAFLSQRANRQIRKSLPAKYLPKIDEEKLAQQCVPTDPDLWELKSFPEFLEKRRTALSQEINRVLKDPIGTPTGSA